MADAVIKGFLMKSLVRLSRKPQAKVLLEKQEGSILDVGGGGEGTIAKACGRETVCVDIKKGEILEARSRGAVANWVLCDACSLPFKDGVFDVATFFFSLMYIKTLDKKHTVIVETRRVLKSSGSIYLWEAIIREKPDLSVVFVESILPDRRKIYTGYGVRGKTEKEQNLELLSKLAFDAGFRATRTESHKNWFAARFNCAGALSNPV